MPIVAGDWSVNQTTKAVRYIGAAHGGGSPSYSTVIDFHRWLEDLADDAAFAGNDEIDITSLTPSDRSTDNIITLINGYNIDDTAAEHLYDGSIIQDNGNVIYDGIVNYGNASFINLMQNGALVTSQFWNSFTPLGFNTDAAQGISHRFLQKVRTGGADIDGRRLLGMSRPFGKTYSEFPIAGTSRGNNVLALSESSDLNNQTIIGTVAGWNDIVNDFQGYVGIDADGNGSNEFYYSNWELGAQSKNNFFERMKWLTRQGSASTLYGLNGQVFRGITHEIDIDTPTGTFQQPEQVTWPTGSGQLLAINSVTAGTKMWIQLLTGTPPVDNQTITGATSAATCLVNLTVTQRPIKTPFVGDSTGSALITSFGLGIGADDLGAADKVTDLTNTLRIPPNNVTFTVNGIVNAEDRVLVGPESGGTLNKGQFLLNAGITAGAASIVVKAGTETPGTGTNSATDTPTAGTIRVQGDDGKEYRVTYTGRTVAASTMTFTGCTGAPTAAINKQVYISYIDLLAAAVQASFTAVFAAPRALFVRVRDGGGTPIKTFETTATLGSGGGSTTVIRTSDI